MSSLTSLVHSTLKLDYHSESFTEAFKLCMKYVARGYYKRKTDFHADIAKHADFKQLEISAKDFRMSLDSQRYNIVNLKYYILRLLSGRLTKEAVQKMYPKYGLCANDAALVWNTLRNKKFARELREAIYPTFDFDISKDDVSPEALASLTSLINQALTDMKKTIRGRVRNELRWISMSQNIAYADLENDLISSVVFAFNQSVPNRYSYQHQVNYLGLSVGNRIANIHAEYSSEKRRRMFNVGTADNPSYSVEIMSENQLNHCASSDSEVSYESLLGAESQTHTSNMEFELSASEVLAKTKGTKRGSLYSVLLGVEVPEFTQFLTTTRRLRGGIRTGLDWLASKSREDMVHVLAEWLDVHHSTVAVGIKRLGWSLGCYDD